jgi:hypothetical protein
MCSHLADPYFSIEDVFLIPACRRFFSVCVSACLRVCVSHMCISCRCVSERFEPDEVVAFILEGFIRVMNCSDIETLELSPVYTDCDVLIGDGKNIGTTYNGVNRVTKGQMADTFADQAGERRLLDLVEGGYVAPLEWPWSDSDDRLWGGGMPVDEGPPNVLCFTDKGVKNGIVNVLSSEMIVGYFIVGEVYQMGRGIFLFVGGPLASLIADVKYGHLVFYFINTLQALILFIILIASWRRYAADSACVPRLSHAQLLALVLLPVLVLALAKLADCAVVMRCAAESSRWPRTFGCAWRRLCLCLSCLSWTIGCCPCCERM